MTEMHDLGTTIIGDIFVSRPQHCRYAVLEISDVEFWVVDLFNLVYEPGSPQTKECICIDTKRAYPTLDAAIVAASITH